MPVDKKVDSSLIFIDHVSLQSEVMAVDFCTKRLGWPDSQIETLIDLLQKKRPRGLCLVGWQDALGKPVLPDDCAVLLMGSVDAGHPENSL